MKTLYHKNINRFPIKIWLEDIQALEDKCLEQAQNLSTLPFLHKWVALMPDAHTGMGMPIGGVIATKNVLIPHAVGADIGCGMIYAQTDLDVVELKSIETGQGTLLHTFVNDVLRTIPVGFAKHKTPQASNAIEVAMKNETFLLSAPELLSDVENAKYQVGTLGGGNHFIEFQEDENGKLGIMIHSGSRHLGKRIGDVFHAKAKQLNALWHSDIPKDYQLAFLPVDSNEGQAYLEWMQFALDYAYENRERMMQTVIQLVNHRLSKHTSMPLIETENFINCHHNYAALEHHYDENVWVHRKGAIRVREGELGIIPGAMGSYSYIVKGKGHPESFCSCSHGAGRKHSRTQAKALYSVESVILDLRQEEVILGKHNKNDIADESRFAYKNIDEVIENELDLITPIKKLKTVGVIKG